MEHAIAGFLAALILVGSPCYLLGMKLGIKLRLGVEKAMQERIDMQKIFLKEDRDAIRQLHAELSAIKYPQPRDEHRLSVHWATAPDPQEREGR